MSEVQPVPPSQPSNDSTTFAVLTWIGTLIFGFIPPLIVFLVKKDDALVQDQAKEALNWSITAIIGYVAGSILSIILIGFLVIIAVGIVHLVFCILGAVKSSKGEYYRLPFNIRLIK
ncbi:DUF4870 domain-containing protein [Chitinolyticbacter meiyuanensis]|uniref:DUF4870 domain-containing protein n=1 Tax=Chitinolyticbacter meiyuanensis TaxID=682798 RepID=UPI0011E60062|nr:DUF4870 domain-containing protein [Chitinolyticbacter meiyuanensis]